MPVLIPREEQTCLFFNYSCLFLNMVDTSKRKDGKEKREAPIPIGSQ